MCSPSSTTLRISTAPLGMKSESFNEGGDDQTLIETAIRILEKESDGGLKLNRLM